MKLNTHHISFLILLLIPLSDVLANVKMPALFSDNMVLQRDEPVKCWGWAEKSEAITVSINGRSVKTKADQNGKWVVTLPAMPAGGLFQLKVKGNNELVFNNVTFGDVWICSGQSNMEWSVNAAKNANHEISNAKYLDIRLFTVPNVASTIPKENIDGDARWEVCTPQTVASFSAVGYFFGRDLHKSLNVPIGLISSDWGGTIIEAWTSTEAITEIPEFKNTREKLTQFDSDKLTKEKTESLKKIIGEIPTEDKGFVDGTAYWADAKNDFSSWKEIAIPGNWETTVLPNIDGIVWMVKTVDLTEEHRKGPVMLNLGPIDDSDITWINGTKVGGVTGNWQALREYNIDPKILRAGKNTIVVRVEDTGGLGGFGGKPDDVYLMAGGNQISLAGDWRYKVGKVYLNAAIDPNSIPSLIFNGMISPLTQYNITGVIWYQGESNATKAYQYRSLLTTMINDWRRHWNEQFTFLLVQLANVNDPVTAPAESEWAELREAQAMALALPKTGMAVTLDIGEAHDIHPKNKQDVGKRLALAALHVSYNREIVYSGPVYKSMKAEGNKVRITFTNTGSGLTLKDKYGYVKGFAVAGQDREFHWAKGTLEGNEIVIWSDEVTEPVAIRYGWAQNPDDANVYNKEGLPAAPFRTDSWKGITQNHP